ncbi:hypothetical protein CC117_20915 [Parafrankia colletiae]|uniref:Uncharacterized protein n=1 Tax=Parafrankia colletiae TaxID=573497 RepID=A0A1S1QM51_9ACTN|nr:hypothetical protein [Parafrankia colletiae]MCK9900605.1 hypothetical protein [Frankia sp. Cpl3]OHV34669.1 hypothetical protein CC117_20915 [Parafrankia colletiae]
MDPYDWWQQRLTAEFFGPAAHGRPVILHLDDEKVQRLRGSSGPDLVGALQSRLDWDAREDIFDGIFRAETPWRRTRPGNPLPEPLPEPPPCLPLLAVCVLAATRMHRDGSAWSSNYYRRLVDLLPMPRGSAQETNRRLKSSYEQIPSHWETLRGWMWAHGGARGLVTFQEGRQTRIGFALSQAVVRKRDLPELDGFFRSPAGQAAARRGPADLVVALRRWEGLRMDLLSPPLRDALRSPRPVRDEVLGGVLAAVADSPDRVDGQRPTWSTVLTAVPGAPTPEARWRDLRRLALLPTFLDDGWGDWQVGWYAPVVDGVAGDTLHGASDASGVDSGGGGGFEVRAEPDRSSYRLTGDLPDAEAVLSHGLYAAGARLKVEQPARGVLLATENSAAGAWVATAVVESDEPLLLVVRDDLLDAVMDMLAGAGADEVHPEQGPFPGWQVLREIVLTDAALAGARLRDLGAAVTVRVSRRPRLVGGLPVGRESGAGAWGSRYLIDGPPDLVLPAEWDPTESVLLDGHRLPAPPADRTIPLRSLSLSEGLHTVQVGGHTRQFTLHPPQPLVLPAPTGETRWGETRLTVPYGTAAYFFLSDGHAIPIREPEPPRWWRRRRVPLRAFAYRVTAPPEAVWLALDGAPRRVHQLREVPPSIGELNAVDTAAWARFVLASDVERPERKAWEHYRRAALNRRHANATAMAGRAR